MKDVMGLIFTGENDIHLGELTSLRAVGANRELAFRPTRHRMQFTSIRPIIAGTARGE